MLLADSLGGNTTALMIACCSSAKSAVFESIRTLQFAMGVKRVKNKVVVMMDPQVWLAHPVVPWGSRAIGGVAPLEAACPCWRSCERQRLS